MNKKYDNMKYSEITGEIIKLAYDKDKIIVELKAIEKISKINEVQLVNYLKATKTEVGLLINFGDRIEIKRRVN